MTFTSMVFATFFSIFIVIYYLFDKNLKTQNLLIAIGSVVFYGWWSFKFLLLMLFSTGVDYLACLGMDHSASEKNKKILLRLSIATNMSILFVFKYYNFFADNATYAMQSIGLQVSPLLLDVILPIGISFYTFQSLSYTIDVYKGVLPAERSYINYLCFSTFFPHLVAGPIMRADNLLPQVKNTRDVNAVVIKQALWLIVWGYFLKVVIADTSASYVEFAFAPDQENAITFIIGTLFFSLQIYGDFCGYSLIAMGVAKLLGFNIPWNFNIPYASTSIRDFWRRWHITLGAWVRDYVYIPLGGSKNGFLSLSVSTLIAMLVIGLWHGASWNFVLWGGLIGIALVINSAWTKYFKSHRYLTPVYWMLTMFVVLLRRFKFEVQR